ncbi:hypothetical protein EDB81DRAFT_67076 [Dactylonectria macrodidyma]|uniref:Uncharacterized protein n=1 Tax=Dactylonectria macrodidyma TaxID=307937 RepID=A0A9P9J0L5_9HYPO|nr:hypothetical protein EDB81DRAFT_67076 [Dactylonectria macrodidyma]
MEVEASGQNPIHMLEPWRHNACLGCHDDIPCPTLDGELAKVPRCPASDPLLEELLKEAPYKSNRKGTDLKTLPLKRSLLHTLAHLPRPDATTSAFTFSLPDDSTQPFTIRASPFFTPYRGVKRRRCLSDVDGFDTARMSSKKRRLRVDLITSRLSQPYSQPATHILNREGQESGDKRFLKMATTLDSARRSSHLHATSFLRYCTMNCLRKRLNQQAYPGLVARRDDQEAAAVASKAGVKGTWRPQSIQDTSAGQSLRVSAAPTPTGGPGISISAPIPLPFLQPTRPQPTASKHTHPHPHVKPPACRLSNPAALPLPATDASATKQRTSPRIYPVQSPELRPSLPSMSLPQLDDLEEDSFAFLHPADDDWDDGADDQDSVYTDFSVVFGQENPGGSDNKDERTYEEYLDELDGICWVSR